MAQTLHIKNMVCHRCIMAVESVLKTLNIPVQSVVLGSVVLADQMTISLEQQQALAHRLDALGFALLEDATTALIESLKHSIIEYARAQPSAQRKQTLSSFLAHRHARDYSALSNLFSQMVSMTIERFYILHRIEFAKELIAYNEQTFTEIADRLGYSSTAHLSSQFKSITGMTPKEFRVRFHHADQSNTAHRASLDSIGHHNHPQS